jgi:CheY-like chemotaxis protein
VTRTAGYWRYFYLVGIERIGVTSFLSQKNKQVDFSILGLVMLPAFYIISESGYESSRITGILRAYKLQTKCFNLVAEEIPFYLWDALRQGGTPVIVDIDAEHMRTKRLVRQILQAGKREHIIGISAEEEKLVILQAHHAEYVLRKPVSEPELLRTAHAYLSKQ